MLCPGSCGTGSDVCYPCNSCCRRRKCSNDTVKCGILDESFGTIRLLFSLSARPFPLVNHTTSAYPDGQTKNRQSDGWQKCHLLPCCPANRFWALLLYGLQVFSVCVWVCVCVLTFNQRILPFNSANKAKAPKCDSSWPGIFHVPPPISFFLPGNCGSEAEVLVDLWKPPGNEARIASICCPLLLPIKCSNWCHSCSFCFPILSHSPTV